jgi:hypothetical protein
VLIQQEAIVWRKKFLPRYRQTASSFSFISSALRIFVSVASILLDRFLHRDAVELGILTDGNLEGQA